MEFTISFNNAEVCVYCPHQEYTRGYRELPCVCSDAQANSYAYELLKTSFYY